MHTRRTGLTGAFPVLARVHLSFLTCIEAEIAFIRA